MSTEIRPLTGVRGIAAFIVMVYHYGHPYGIEGVKTHFLVRQGFIAVDLFYVLSGFVLALTYGEWFSQRFHLNQFKNFMLRRVARLYPAYLVITAAIFLRAMIRGGGSGLLNYHRVHDYILNFLMMTGVGLNVMPIIGDSWSVSAELVAYVFFPVLVFFAVFHRPAVAVIVFCFAVAGIIAVTRSGLGFEGPLDVVSADSLYPLLRCVSEFTIGLLLFRISRISVLHFIMSSELFCGATVFAVSIAWALHASDLLMFVCLALLVLALSFNGTVANRLFGSRPVHYLGEVSYSLYLIHETFIGACIAFSRVVQHRYGVYGLYPIFAVVAWAGSIALAGASMRWIEKPSRRWVMASVSRPSPPRIA